MQIKSIETEQEYREALKRLEVIFDAAADTEESDEADVLGTLIDEYEKIHFPIDLPNPNEAIKFRMEQVNYGKNELT